MKAPSPPPTPDPYKTSAAQQMANVEVAIANTYLSNADEYRPDGSTITEMTGETLNTYTYDADGLVTSTRAVPKFKKTTTLSPKGQVQFDQQQDISISMNTAALGLAAQLETNLSQPFRVSTLLPRGTVMPLPSLMTTAPTLRAMIREIGQTESIVEEKDQHRRALMERLNWQTDVDRDARIVALSNKCIYPGMEAYEREMRPFDRQVSDNRLAVEGAVGAEHTRMVELTRVKADFFNAVARAEYEIEANAMDLGNRAKLHLFECYAQIGQFMNSLRSVDMQEQLTERQTSVNEASALMHGGQVQIHRGEAFRAGSIAQTPVSENVYRSAAMDMQKWQMQVQNQQQMMGGMMGLFGNLISLPMMSDRRLKADIVKRSDDARGFGWYTWRYLWDRPGTQRYGVMAQEVSHIPGAVIETADGWLMVNYGALS